MLIKKLVFVPLAIVLLSFSVSIADDFAAGVRAFEKGDYKTALKVLKSSAKQGESSAMHNLGFMYQNGYGAPKDYREAIKWFRLAAKQHHAGAQNNLGFMYINGLGVPKDDKKAVQWFRLAAENGSAGAQFTLGDLYREGDVVPKDITLAAAYYTKAARQGFAQAQSHLGTLLANHGQPQDTVYAYMWLNLAATNGVTKAAENIKILAKEMTQRQIEEAQKLSRECFKKEYKNCY